MGGFVNEFQTILVGAGSAVVAVGIGTWAKTTVRHMIRKMNQTAEEK